ncbi:hypothetical protein F4825DRAFT_451040 [Nemania diffusa]|nr:hypothetical protein F4825DRAFT_451040 [Nemania diffusa]
MAGQRDDLDTKIGQLLQLNSGADTGTPAELRKQADYQRLESLSVATTSGDTLVIVNFPPGNFVNCHGWKWGSKEFLMNSQQLLATGSSVFAKKLSPEGQEQAKRRLSRDGKTHTYAKYVLDLTPPAEGDELASQVAQLSLSQGVRDWWLSHYVLGVSKHLVFGHDDVCTQHIEAFLSEVDANKRQPTSDSFVDIGFVEYPMARKIADYCPIRHRAAILRLLLAISHGDLVLDSAPRTATMAVVARVLDCEKVVTDSVLSWLIEEPNQNFIDVNPEDALTIAWTLQLPSVARGAFRVLVVERAMEILDKKRAGDTNKQRLSIFGRPRGTVGEEPDTCIQHAAQRLGQRAEELCARLKSYDVVSYLGIKQWPDHDPEMCQRLRYYIHRTVQSAEDRPTTFEFSTEPYDRNRARYESEANLVPTRDIYQTLSPTQRILTSCFWRSLFTLANSYDNLERHFAAELSPGYLPFYSPQLGTQQRADEFDIRVFKREFTTAILNLEYRWVSPALEVNIPQHSPLVLGLSEDEFKFLPLWAGGLDDETGAVFQSDIPDAERGFPIGPGPSFRTGETISGDDDEMSTIKGSDDAATVATGTDTETMTGGYSVIATDSQTTSLDYDEIILAAAAAEISLTNSQGPDVASAVQEDMTPPFAIRMPTASHDNLDWMIESSDDEDIGLDDTEDLDMS